MRAFRPKPFRTKAAAAEVRSDGLTDEQHKAMLAEFGRRIVEFEEQWRCCGDGRCRRRRHCLGPPFVCNGNGSAPATTNKQYRRLRRDIHRKPPRI
jgi:hypothetical protein